MAYLVIGKNNTELIFQEYPIWNREESCWMTSHEESCLRYIDSYDYSAGTEPYNKIIPNYGVELPKGTIIKLLGYDININNEPIRLE